MTLPGGPFTRRLADASIGIGLIQAFCAPKGGRLIAAIGRRVVLPKLSWRQFIWRTRENRAWMVTDRATGVVTFIGLSSSIDPRPVSRSHPARAMGQIPQGRCAIIDRQQTGLPKLLPISTPSSAGPAVAIYTFLRLMRIMWGRAGLRRIT